MAGDVRVLHDAHFLEFDVLSAVRMLERDLRPQKCRFWASFASSECVPVFSKFFRSPLGLVSGLLFLGVLEACAFALSALRSVNGRSTLDCSGGGWLRSELCLSQCQRP